MLATLELFISPRVHVLGIKLPTVLSANYGAACADANGPAALASGQTMAHFQDPSPVYTGLEKSTPDVSCCCRGGAIQLSWSPASNELLYHLDAQYS